MRKRKIKLCIYLLIFVLFMSLHGQSYDKRAFAGQSTAANPGAESGSGRIKVITYNIHRGIGKDGKLDLSRIYDAVSGANADIVALQEVERFSVRTGFQDQIAYLADKLSMYYVYGKSINILNGQFGNAILSKYPIESYQLELLPSEGESRTLLRADVEINGNRFVIYTTHLGLNKEERSGQIKRIAELTDNVDYPYVILGDFNCNSGELTGLTDKTADSAACLHLQSQATFEDESLSGRIDYILLSDKVELLDYLVVRNDASDHYPIWSIIEIK